MRAPARGHDRHGHRPRARPVRGRGDPGGRRAARAGRGDPGADAVVRPGVRRAPCPRERPAGARRPAMQPAIIRSWFQRSSGRAAYDARRSRRPVTRTSCSKSIRVPPTLVGQPPADHALEVAGQAGLEQVRLAALGVQQQVEGVGQRRPAQHPGVVVGDLRDRADLRPPLGVALEVEQHRLHPFDRRGHGPGAAEGVRRAHGRRPVARSSRRAIRRAPAPPAGVRPRGRRASRSRTASTCSVSPVTASVRSAWARTRGSSWVDSAAAPSPAPADLVPGRDLEAHLGRPPVLVGQARRRPRRSRSRARRRAARGRPSCAASSPPTSSRSWPARRRTSRPVR